MHSKYEKKARKTRLAFFGILVNAHCVDITTSMKSFTANVKRGHTQGGPLKRSVFTLYPFFAYTGGYSTNIGFCNCIPIAISVYYYPLTFPYIGGYSTSIGKINSMLPNFKVD